MKGTQPAALFPVVHVVVTYAVAPTRERPHWWLGWRCCCAADSGACFSHPDLADRMGRWHADAWSWS